MPAVTVVGASVGGAFVASLFAKRRATVQLHLFSRALSAQLRCTPSSFCCSWRTPLSLFGARRAACVCSALTAFQAAPVLSGLKARDLWCVHVCVLFGPPARPCVVEGGSLVGGAQVMGPGEASARRVVGVWFACRESAL